MFRLMKEENGKKEILSTDEDEYIIIKRFRDYVVEHSSNNYEEYSCADFEAIEEKRHARVLDYNVYFDEALKMDEKEFLSKGGNICIHCHSDDVEEEDLYSDIGCVTKVLSCNMCDKETVEKYTLSGLE